MKRVAVDVGGTFTDFVFWDDVDQMMEVHKVPSTPVDPSSGMMVGISELCQMSACKIGQLDQIVHATTIGTNTVLERKGSTVGMITTEGFRDILHVGRHRRPLGFSLYQDLPWQKYPLAKRRHRLTVRERIVPPEGDVLHPLDEDQLRRQIRRLQEASVEAVAICFLFSFLNPMHELRAKEILAEEWPEVWVSASSEISSRMREYERFSTACMDAYIGTAVSKYVNNVDSQLKDQGFSGSFYLMTSSGGLVTARGACEKPVTMLMSGPVAGLLGGIWMGETAGEENVISLDVGGTSADIGVAPAGEIRLKHLTDSTVGGHGTIVPTVDVETIGAGGGSIAYVDEGGVFRVGPISAGADPGPASYGRGGDRPTVTDAALIAGILSPERPLGGSVYLQSNLAAQAIKRYVATPLGLELHDAAIGVLSIVVQNMVQAIELNSIRKGYDPRDFALVAIGGAGPMFGTSLAQELSIPRVVVPPYPGIGSAMGLLTTDVAYDVDATLFGRISELATTQIEEGYAALMRQAEKRLAAENIPPPQRRLARYAECHFRGQAYELRVECGSGPITTGWLEDLSERFEREYRGQFGLYIPDADIELVTIGVQAIGSTPPLELPRLEQGRASVSTALTAERDLWVAEGGKAILLEQVPVYDRDLLRAGNLIQGPAIVEQFDTTTLINRGTTGHVDAFGNIIIDCGKTGR